MKTRPLTLLVFASFLVSSHSATITWDAGGDGVSWHDPLNWSGNVLPGAADDVSIALAGAAVVHSIGDHSVRSVTSSRPLTMSGGSLTATNGLRVNNSVFTFSGGTISNTVRLVSSTLNMGATSAPGATILLNGLCSFTGVIPAGQLLWIEGRLDAGLARLTATNSFTNQGTIRLETTQNDYADRGSYLVVQNGVLWNSAAGRIEANAGMGDGRSITGTVWNEGTLVAGAGTTLVVAGDLTQAGGQIQGDGEFRVDGGRVDFLGGTLTGLVRAQNAALWVADSVTTASELRVVGPNNILVGNLSPSVTLWVEGRVDYGLARLTATNEVTNLGIIHLETTQNDVWDRSSYLACGPGLINGPSGRIEAVAGAGDSRPTTGRLVNQGQVDAQTTLDFTGTIESAGGTYTGSFYVHDSSLRVTSSPSTPTTLHLRGPNNQLLTDNLAGSTLWIEGRVDYDRARLTAIGTRTNHGVIRLETSQNDVWDRGSSLTVQDGILHNAPDGRIEANPGEGDSRVLTGAVWNEGLIVAASNTTFSVSGNVTQAAGEIRGDGEFRMDGGLFDFVGGVLTGLVRAQNGNIWVAPSVAEASVLRLVNRNNLLRGNLSPTITLWVEGRVDYDQARLTVPSWTTNLGVIRLETTQNDVWDRGSYLDCAGGLFNGPAGTLVSRQGAGDGRLVTGYLVNAGQALADADCYLDFVGTLSSAGGTYTGPVYIHDSSLLVTASPPAPTTLRLRGQNNRLLTDNLPGTTLWIEGRVDYDQARLTVMGNATNHGTIRLETTQNDVWDRGSYLVATEGVFRNAEGGRIEAVANQGDTRGISSWQFRNAGLLLAADTSLSLSANSGVIINEPAGIIAGSGTLNLGSGTLENQGVIRPGASPGALTVSGDYLQTATGRLEVEIGGLTAGTEFDRLAVTGNANLNGALEVSFITPFEPSVGDNFRVLTCGLLNGRFASLNAPIWKTNHAFNAVHFVRGVELQTTTTGTNQIQVSAVFPIVIGQVVNDGQPAAGAGRLDHRDEQDLFTFTNRAGQRLYFDVLAVSTAAARWEILDAAGRRVFEGRMWDGDAGQFTFSAAGANTVRVYGDGSATGTYSFKIWEVTASEQFEIAIGQVVSNGVPAAGAGNIETPGAEDVFTFTNAPGDRIYANLLTISSASLRWALFDATGARVFDLRMWDGDAGEHLLAEAGTNTLRVYGSADGTGTYAFKLWSVGVPQTFAIAIGQTVTNGVPAAGAGSIETPGGEDVFTFTHSPGQRLYVDLLAISSANLRWALFDATGARVFDLRMWDGDAGDYLLAEGGASTLRVYGNADGTGTYAFKLWSLGGPQKFDVAIGQTVTNGVPSAGAGNIEAPGTEDVYSFTNAPGERLFVDLLAISSANLRWALFDTTGARLFDLRMWDGDAGEYLLADAGTNTLRVYGNADATGTYAFRLWSVSAPQLFSIAVGQAVSNGVPLAGAGSIETPGAEDLYFFTNVPGQTLFFDSRGDTPWGGLRWAAFDLRGNRLFDLAMNQDGGKFTLNEAGTNRVRVYGSVQNTGTYGFSITNLPPETVTNPPIQYFTIALGTVVSNGLPEVGAGNIEGAKSQDVYYFVVTNRQTVYLQTYGRTGYLGWQLLDPNGNQLRSAWLYSDLGSFALTEAGTYRVVTWGDNNTAVGTYSFKLWGVADPGLFPIGLNQTVTNDLPAAGAGNIETPGAQDIYTFSAQAGTTIYLQRLAWTNGLGWTLLDPDGNSLRSVYLYYDLGTFTLTSSGKYRLVAWGDGASTGTYSFRLWEVPPPTVFPLSLGQTVTNGAPAAGAGNIETPGAQDIYTLSVEPGQTVYFQTLAYSSGLGWTLQDPDGIQVASVYLNSDLGRLTLAASGQYRLVVWGDTASTGAYSFKAWAVPDPGVFSIALGVTVTNGVPSPGAGQIETVGAQDVYTFNGTAGQTIYLQKLAWSSGLYWLLQDPDGNQLRSTWLSSDLGRFTLTRAGAYRVVVLGDHSSIGAYSLKLWSDAPEISIQPQSQTVLAGLTASFSVTATYPETITYRWQCNGGELAGETSSLLTLPSVQPAQAGAYTVVVSGPSGSVTSTVAALTVQGPTTGEALVNGGFEFGPNPGIYLTRNAGDTSIVGWEVTGATIDYVGSCWSAADGSRSLDLDGSPGPGGVRQTFTTQPGVTYQVDFSLAANFSASGVRRMRVSAAGQSAEYECDPAGHSSSAMGWTRQAFTFVALSNQTTLAFDSLSAAGSQTGVALDAVSAVGYLTTNAPDLLVTALQAPAMAVAGQPAQIIVTVTNAGVADTASSWSDALFLADNPAGDNAVPLTLLSGGAPLAAKGSLTYSGTVMFPNTLCGTRWLVAQADGAYQVPEGYGETNNRFVAAQPVEIIAPDLQVAMIASPASALFGSSISVGWTVTNSGTSQASIPWNDRVYLSTASDTIAGATLLATVPAGAVPLAPGAICSTARTVSLPLVSGQTPGAYFILVAADAGNAQPESSESNNLRSAPIALDFPPLPDLAVTNLAVPALAISGQNAVLTWVTTNCGNATASGVWSETVELSSDAVIGSDFLLGTFVFTNTIPAGGFLIRTQSVAVPLAGPTGNLRFMITTDHDSAVVEQNETNNAALADGVTQVPAQLSLQLPATQLTEGSPVAYGTVTRNGDRSQPLTVTLECSDLTELLVPPTVLIAAGHASASFSLTAPSDGLVDGPQPVQVMASATGFTGATNQLTVLDIDVPGLQLVIIGDVAREGDALEAVVSRSVVTDRPLVVILGSSSANQLSAPPSVTIPASAASVAFSVTAVDDSLYESTRSYSITASADGFQPSLDTVTVLDNDVPELTLTLSAATMSESAGNAGAIATVTRSFPGPALVVRLESSDATEAAVPATVEIPAGYISASFPVAAVDDALLDGPQVVTISAAVAESLSGNPIPPAATAQLTVTDDDGPTLTLSIARDVVAEGLSPATSATVTRNTPPTNTLIVTLLSSDSSEATVPVTVTIPAGAATASFDIASVADGVTDGNQTVTITASASGFTTGNDTLVVTDINLPDLAIASLSAPTNGLTEAAFSVTYREANLGLATATGTWAQAVWLSKDPLPGDDELLGEFEFSGTLPPGLFLERTLQFRLPQLVGSYWIIVTADPHNTVPEVLENNNTRVSTHPLVVSAAYTATVQAGIHSALANTPVPLSGTALRAGTSAPAQYELVNIHIKVRGTRRIISALTDASGRFGATFTPLPGEAGSYTVGAAHPGEADAPVQDAFVLLGAKLDPASLTLKVGGLGAVTNVVSLMNLGDVPLSGLSASLVGVGGSLSVHAELPSVLPGLEVVPLTLIVRSLADEAISDNFNVLVTSAQGTTNKLSVTANVEPLRPRLATEPGSLVAGMLRGGQTIVSFVVRNEGGAESGPLNLVAPALDFLHVATPLPLPSLLPGASNTITLQLRAATDQPLGDYTGNLVVAAAATSVSVPYSFRTLSEARGNLVVEAVDEYTYYADSAPRLAGASVLVRDAMSNEVATNGVTGSNGVFTAAALREGYYNLELTASQHSVYRGFLLVPAGDTTNVTAFLSRQAVQYIWKVEPTEIEDRTRITITTTFETFVPMPVVTIEPTVIDLLDYTNDVTQIELKVTNHGLIAAQDAHLSFPDLDGWRFTPLVTALGDLPARSTFTIPLVIERVGARSALAKGAQSRRSGGCGGIAQLIYSLICGPTANSYGVSASIVNASDGCGGAGGWISAGGGGGAAGIFTPPSGSSVTNDCKPCTNDISVAVLECLISFTPAGCPYDLIKATYECGSTAWTNGLTSQTAQDCAKGFILPVVGCALELFEPAALAYNVIKCAYDIANAACNGPGGGSGPRSVTLLRNAKDGSAVAVSYDLGPLRRSTDRYQAAFDAYNYALGDPVWFSGVPGDEASFKALMHAYRLAIEPGSENAGRVSAAERAAMLGLPRPSQITSNHIERLCDRWNRTLDYYDAGIFLSTQVPFGQNPDFLAFDVYLSKLAAADAAGRADQAEGFSEIGASVERALQDLAAQLGARSGPGSKAAAKASSKADGGGVCATVVLRLDQDAVLTRDAFRATLDLINSSGTTLSNVTVALSIQNAAGQTASGLFFVTEPELNNLTGVNGNGTVADGLTGSAAWTLVPYPEATPGNSPVSYFVSGRLSYTQEGLDISIPLASTPITVYPTPSLRVKYFHERDVFSDDPFTEEVEPAVPYSLGVFVQNVGRGTARNFRIISGEPQIVDNEKGLLVDFDLIATEVAGQDLSPSLTADFGDLDPGAIGIARWLFKSTLQGTFIDYQATFDHTNAIGGQRLSPIESVEIHELIHIVCATNTLPDARPDFLVNDLPDSDLDLPDTLYLSDGSTMPVSAVTAATANGAPTTNNLSVQLMAVMPPGWSYLRAPANVGGFALTRVVRSDGAELPAENFWITTRTFIAGGRRPLNEANLHLLDYNSTGSYTLTYALPAGLDLTPPASAIVALPPASYPQIPLSWTGDDEQGGSGLAFFDVYVSVSGGPFVAWLERTTLTGAIYQGTNSGTYSFYTVATDRAGNRETPPGSPDAQTTVSLVNTAPTLTAGASQTVDEGTLVTIANTASDPDLPAQRLVFSLGLDAPAGATIDAATGLISWPTGEGTGPSTNRLAVIVHDSGFPSLSATGVVTIVVREVNAAPVITPISLQRVSEGVTLYVSVSASDSDLPPNRLTFRLGGTPPTGATIDANTGLFQWKPSPLQGPSTNVIPVVVTDNGQPSLSATQLLSVIVRDVQGDFVVSMGITNLLAGESSSVPIVLTSDDLTALSFDLTLPLGRLTNLVLTPRTPDLTSALLSPVDEDHSQLSFQFNPATLVNGSRELARLQFGSISSQPSAIVPLNVSALLGRRTSGLLLTNGKSNDGRLIVVNDKPVLMAERTPLTTVVLYGIPGKRYALEYTTALASSPAATVWLPLTTVTLTDRMLVVNVTQDLPTMFVRARETP